LTKGSKGKPFVNFSLSKKTLTSSTSSCQSSNFAAHKYNQMKQFFTITLLLCCLGSFAQMRISQVYGGGGNAGATYTQDFVELFNAGSSPVAIGGWSVQYASFTGTAWAVTAIPAGATVAPGQYYLVGLAVGGATGIALPTPDVTGTSNMSATAGKVALVNSTTALSGSTACSNASVVDVLGYGTAVNTPSCSETAFFSTTGITAAQAMVRAANGCTDVNNNSTDFAIGTVTPRNSASPTNSCGGPTATIIANPNISNMTTSVGTASASQSYNLSASNLTPAAGNITVTPSAGLEISTDNASFGTATINVPYTAGGITPAVPIYVRIAASAPQGAISGSITHTGGGAPTATVTVSGGVFQNYYSKATGALENTATWGTNTDGSGSAPANFTNPYQLFNVVNQANATILGNWDVAGTSSRIIVGNGTAATELLVPNTAAISTTSRVDVSNNATLRLENNTRPFLGSLATGSTVNFAQGGTGTTDTIRIPNISYHNLSFTGGLKYFSSGTTTIRGNFVADGVVSMNGAGSPFTTVNAFGNLSFQNGAAFEPQPSGDGARLTLAMNGSSGTQTISGNGTTLRLFRLRRDTTSSSVTINLGSNTNLVLGNNAGGGLQLNQGAATTTELDIASNTLSLIGAAVSTTSSQGILISSGGTIIVNKTAGTTNAGTLRFDPTNEDMLNQIVMNFDAAQTRDSITIVGTVGITNNLTLTRGRLVIAPTHRLVIDEAATITGGSTVSFVDGKMSRSSSTSLFFPMGKGTKYAPVQLNNMGGFNSYDVQYFNSGLGTYVIDPITLIAFPNYNVSGYEYWNIEQGDVGTCDITFNYTDANSLINTPNAIRMAHHDGTDWDDIGGTPAGTNTTTSGSVTVTGVSEFSPFTFAAITSGVIPVRISSFTARKRNSSVQVNWTTELEINSRHFVVQRSTGNGNWVDLATIAAAGNSSTTQQYSLVDNTPAKGINLYRLLQVDNDGKAEYSVTRSVLFGSQYEVTVAPNPASDFINVFVGTNGNEAFTVQLHDMNGRLLKTVTSREARVQLATSSLPKGLYMVKVMEGDNLTNHKVMVQ
jgi:hypothetical protein